MSAYGQYPKGYSSTLKEMTDTAHAYVEIMPSMDNM